MLPTWALAAMVGSSLLGSMAPYIMGGGSRGNAMGGGVPTGRSEQFAVPDIFGQGLQQMQSANLLGNRLSSKLAGQQASDIPNFGPGATNQPFSGLNNQLLLQYLMRSK